MGGWMTCVLAAGALAACSNGIELDVHAGSAVSVQVFPIGSDACSILPDGSARCGDGVSLDGGSAVYGPGAIKELSRDPKTNAIVTSPAAPVVGVDHVAKVELDISPVPVTVFRIVVVGYDSDGSAVDAAVLQSVPFTSDNERIDVYLENPNVQQWSQPATRTSGPGSSSSAPPVPEPCIAIADVNGPGEPEYYVPNDDHDCDGYLMMHPARGCVTGDCECDDLDFNYDKVQMIGSAADQCVADVTSMSNGSNVTTCATGITSCQDGPGFLCAFDQTTTCYPEASCGPCRDVCEDFGSAGSANCYQCLQGQLTGELGSGTAPTLPGTCTLIIDDEGDLCVGGSAQLAGTAVALTLLPCTAVLGVDGLSTTFGQPVVAGTNGSLPVSMFLVPFSMSPPNTTTTCSIAFLQPSLQTMAQSASADFMARIATSAQDDLEVPFKLFVSQLAGPCGQGDNSACDSQLSGAPYGTCAN
jgi:hypothetical protein